MKIIEGKTGTWEIVIGLEVHAQVTAGAKLFSLSSTKSASLPNQQVSLVDAAMPGTLPVLNTFCIQQAIKTGIALNAKINLESAFDRKNYFYPDLPQGYQISQFYRPIVSGGQVTIEGENLIKKDIGIHHIHLEQDAGKSIHDYSPKDTYIDLNRAGVALMEIVSEADMRSAEEAAEYVQNLRSILRYIKTCDGNMEQGSLRCDANVSVRRLGEHKLGTRCEIKNLNSIKYIIQAIEYEANRQVELIEDGGVVEQETRLFNVSKAKTVTMRKKEDAVDYRYFPDPDLLTINISENLIHKISGDLPELPDAKHKRYVGRLGLTNYDANVLVADQVVAQYFELVLEISQHKPDTVAKWITGELFAHLNKSNITIDKSPIQPQNLVTILDCITDNTISNKIAKQVFDLIFTTGKDALTIIEEMGLKQITDEKEIEKIIIEVLDLNKDKVKEYQEGKEKLYGFFVGQVMKKTSGKASPEVVNYILKQKLSY